MAKIERFFGLHFDFHAVNDVEVGIRTNQDDIERYIIEARPDFIQCDCKGHAGNCSYPSKLGNAADNLKKDNLRIWCDAAKKHNVPIFVHYSGVWDKRYTEAHYEDTAIKEDGTPSESISLFGNYAENLLIPQLKELITEYGIDGVWIDGDCWAVSKDYSELAKMHLKSDATDYEHRMLMHDAFLAFVKKYVDEIHAFAPDFMITSNWMYSSYIPEKPTVNIDFISGDYPHNNSVHAARYEGRCIAAQNMPWDLMAWSFEWSHFAEKPAIQLQQEAAAVLMLGGGFQMYTTQNKDGSVRQNRSTRIKEISDFVHSRRMLFKKPTVAQVGILYSADSFYRKSNIFNASGVTNPLIGTMNAILDVQYTVNVILEYQLDTLSKYEAVVVPEWEFLSKATKECLLAYAKNGGNLIVIGAECVRQLGEMCGQNFGEIAEYPKAFIEDKSGYFTAVNPIALKPAPAKILDIKKGDRMLFSNSDIRDEFLPACRTDEYGNGKITWIPFSFGTDYSNARTFVHANFIKEILEGLIKPFVTLNRRMIDISIQKDENRLILNLLNMNQGRHTPEVLVYDEISPIYEVEITVNKVFKNVTMPLGEDFKSETDGESTKIYLKKLDIHSFILLEE